MSPLITFNFSLLTFNLNWGFGMKKSAIVIAVLAAVFFIASCGGNSSGGKPTGGNNQAAAAGTANAASQTTTRAAPLVASVTPPAGWQEGASDKDIHVYVLTDKNKKGAGSSLAIIPGTASSAVKTINDFVSKYQNVLKIDDKNAQIGPSTNINVNGWNGVEYTYTTSTEKSLYANLTNGTSYYIIKCTATGNNYDSVAADFKSMIDSFTVK